MSERNYINYFLFKDYCYYDTKNSLNKCKLKTLSIFLISDISVIIPLNATTSLKNKELYSGFVHLNSSSTLKVDFTSINKNVSFVVFQVHSHIYNVTLYNNTLISGSYVSGTNVGLYSSTKPKIDTFYVKNPNSVNLKLYISVHGYAATGMYFYFIL